MSSSGNSSTSFSIQSMVPSLPPNERLKQIFVDPVENDRISKLPDNVLIMILKRMYTEEVIQTSVLSKRWKDVWKQTPFLVFDMENAMKYDGKPLSDRSSFIAQLITKVINNHNGHLESSKIQHLPHQCEDGTIETWIQSLIHIKQTKHLLLQNLLSRRRRATVLNLSPNIFSNPTLTTLSLIRYELKISHAFNKCNNLTTLTLDKIIFPEVGVFNTVIASCPSLKVLILNITWDSQIGCLKIHNNNLKVLHVACTYIDCIEVYAALLDIFSIYYNSGTINKLALVAPRILSFYNNYWGAYDNTPHITYNISSHAQEKEHIGHEFVVTRNNYHLMRFRSMAVNVDFMNPREICMLKEVLNLWSGEMSKLEIFFKYNNDVPKEEGESSIGGEQKKMSKEEHFFVNDRLRVRVVWMYNFSGLNKEEVALASHLVTQGTVMEKLMIKTSSIPTNNKFEIEDAVAKLMEFPKGNKELSIECF